MLATVDDVEARDRHGELAAGVTGKVRIVLEEGNLLSASTGL